MDADGGVLHEVLQVLKDVKQDQAQVLQRIDELATAHQQTNERLDRLAANQQQTDEHIKALIAMHDSSHTSAEPVLQAGPRLVGTFELLEQVLLELRMRDVLLAQRVNKQFNSVINNSKPLQSKLFFTPEPFLGNANNHDNGPRLNELLISHAVCKRLPIFFDRANGSVHQVARGGRTRLFYSRPFQPRTGMESPGDFCWEIFQPRHPQYWVKNIKPLTTGSWKRMYLIQGSCTIDCMIYGSGGMVWRKTVRAEVTMDKFLDSIEGASDWLA